MSYIKRFVMTVCLFVFSFYMWLGDVLRAADVTIPSMPVDFADIATEGAVILGTVVAGVIGIFVIVSLINMGIKWVRRAFTS